MRVFFPGEDVHVTEADQRKILSLLEGGMLLQAHHAALEIGPLACWRGQPARLLAGRMASALGAMRLSEWLTAQAYREDRLDAEAAHYRALDVYDLGAYRAWRFLDRLPDFPNATAVEKAALLALRARVLGDFRDFRRADEAMKAALDFAPEDAWVRCELGWLRQEKDDFDGALAAMDEALALRPLYRAALSGKAELLQMMNRDNEAVDLMRGALATLESGRIASRLARLLTELEQHEQALHWWLKAREYYPMAEPSYVSWLHGELTDSYYNLNDLVRAREHAAQADHPFYRGMRERLEHAEKPVRVLLPVPFIRQHHLTCAPATLSVLSQYWNIPVDHAALAAEICYEGTFDHIERHWAEKKGFIVREFTASWDLARALIDRGIPFALNTVETTSAHLQGVIGYDAVRETLLLREPSKRTTQEVGKDFLSSYLPFGPRGMLMLPPAEAHRLDGLELIDAEKFDAMHRVQHALEVHEREKAAEAAAWLGENHPGHRLTFCARWEIALYDANPGAEKDAIEGLLALYPECGHFLWRLALVKDRLGTERHTYMELVKQLATGPQAEPVFRRRWGYELGRDGRCIREARRYLILALRSQPCNADHLAEMANSLWDEREFEAATEIYRFAACLPGGAERHGKSYFLAARHVRRTEEAIEFLRDQFARSGSASVRPTRALFFALSRLQHNQAGLKLLDEALGLRPNDGELLLFAADEFARHWQQEKADTIMEQARAVTSRTAWARTAAMLAAYRCEYARALALWRDVLEAEPLANDAHRQIAALLGDAEGPLAVQRFLADRMSLFPHYEPLLELAIEWSRDGEPEVSEELIRRELAINPGNAWALRELALNLVRQKRLEEALTATRESVQREPANSTSHQILSYVLRMSGQLGEAREAAHEALRLSVDNTFAIEALFRACSTFEEKKSAVEFVRHELAQQVVFGEGISAFRQEAYSVLGPDAMLDELRDALAQRPDLWQAWIELVGQLVDMGIFDEALAVALEATENFPLLPRCWFELSVVYQRRMEWTSEIEALGRALTLNPGWGKAGRALADAHERLGDFAQARAIIDQAIAYGPLEAINHVYLGNILWLLGEREEALKALQQAVRLDPGYNWAWDRLSEWSEELGLENQGCALARELTVARPREATIWLRLARTLPDNALEEKLEVLDRAQAIDPLLSDIHDVRALAFADAHRYDDAESACSPVVYEGKEPCRLRGRLAWVKAERGDTKTAIEMMRSVVNDWPDYYWGWSRLTDWLTSAEKYTEALDGARQLSRLAPRSSVPQGYIGDLQRKLGNTEAARQAFRTAFSLDPTYSYAGYELLDSLLAEGDLTEAEEIWKRLHLHHSGARTDAYRVRIDCDLKEKEAALSGLRALCFTPERSVQSLRRAADSVIKAGWARAAEKLFRSILHEPGVNPIVGELWVARATTHSGWVLRLSLSKLDPSTPIGLAARYAYLDAAVEVKNAWIVRRMVKRDGASLRQNIRLLGQVSWALSSLGHDHEVVEWLAGWRENSEIQPWILYNLATSLRSIDDQARAHEVSLFALELPADHTTQWHELMLSWDAALPGHVEEARTRLEKVDFSNLGNFHKIIEALIIALTAIYEAEPGDRPRIYKTQKIILQQADWKQQMEKPMLSHMGRITVRKIAALSRRRPFRLGALFKFRTESSLPVAALCIIILLALSGLLRSCSP